MDIFWALGMPVIVGWAVAGAVFGLGWALGVLKERRKVKWVG